jgi:hypothetical protein
MRWVVLITVGCTPGCQSLAGLFSSTATDPATLAGEGFVDLVTGDTISGTTKLLIAGGTLVLGWAGYKGRRLPGQVIRRHRQHKEAQAILGAPGGRE